MHKESHIKILHVDDDAGYQELLQIRIRRSHPGYEIIRVSSVSEALARLAVGDIDCIISDYQMPGRTGIELLVEVRTIDEHIPFIFLTGQGSEEVAAEALRSGASSYFAKDREFALIDRLIKTITIQVQSHRAWMERQKTLAELQKLHHAVMQSPNLIVITDANAKFEFCNSRFEEFTGYSQEDVAGQNPSMLKSGLTPISTYKEMWRALRKGETWRGILVNRKKDGDLYWESASISALRDEHGNIVRYVKVGEDITNALARERKLEMLSEQYRNLERIINSGPSIVFLWRNEPGWPVEFVSTNISHFGYSPDEFLSGSILYRDIIHPDDLQRVEREVSRKKNALSDDDHFEQKYRIRTRAGETIWVKDYTWVKRDETGAITHYQGFILDYTSKKSLEAELDRKNLELETRVRQLGLANAVSRILAENERPTKEIFARIADLIPTGFADQNGIRSRIVYNGEAIGSAVCEGESIDLSVPLHEHGAVCGAIELILSSSDARISVENVHPFIINLAETISLFLGKRYAFNLITRTRNFYQQLIDVMPIPVMRCDARGTISYFNKALSEFIGRTVEDEIAAGWGDSIHPDDRNEIRRQFELALATRLPMTSRMRLRRADGAWRTMLNSVNPVYDESGEFAGLIGSSHDLTDMIESERRISESEEKYRNLVDMAQDGIIITQHDHFVYANQACAEMLGYTVEEMIGSCFTEFIHPDSLPQVSDFYHRRVRGEQVPSVYETGLIDKQGNKRHVEINSRRIVHQGEAAVLTFVRDISHRRQMQMELAHAQKLEAIGHLAAGIAHEINTPIQFIGDNTRFIKRAFTDVLPLIDLSARIIRGETLTGEELRASIRETLANTDVEFLKAEIPEAIGQSLDGLDRVAKIVRAMKSFSHPGSDEKIVSDINKIIEDTVTVSRNEWKYVADLNLDLTPNLPPVPCLPNQISQVFLNLIINAAHAIEQVVGTRGDAKGMINISTGRNNGSVEIKVADSGAGIPEAIRSKIFTPFFTTKPPGKGTGQGLAISLDVVSNKHGGALFFESDPGHGTCFTIRLPLTDNTTARHDSGQGETDATDVR